VRGHPAVADPVEDLAQVGLRGQLVEQDRLDFDSTGAEPEVLRAGIAFSSAGATATVAVDDLRVTDSTLP
jgi:hypothetical protein